MTDGPVCIERRERRRAGELLICVRLLRATAPSESRRRLRAGPKEEERHSMTSSDFLDPTSVLLRTRVDRQVSASIRARGAPGFRADIKRVVWGMVWAHRWRLIASRRAIESKPALIQ